MERDYYTERAYYLSFLNRDVTGRSGEEESLRTTPLFSLAVKHAIDRTFRARRAGTPEPSKVVSDEAVDSASESEDGGSPISDRLASPNPERTLPTPILPQYGLLRRRSITLRHDRIMIHVKYQPSRLLCMNLSTAEVVVSPNRIVKSSTSSCSVSIKGITIGVGAVASPPAELRPDALESRRGSIRFARCPAGWIDGTRAFARDSRSATDASWPSPMRTFTASVATLPAAPIFGRVLMT